MIKRDKSALIDHQAAPQGDPNPFPGSGSAVPMRVERTAIVDPAHPNLVHLFVRRVEVDKA